MVKLYGIGTDLLLVEGDWVINGNWTAIFDKNRKHIIGCKENPSVKKTLPFLLDVPNRIMGNYDEYNEVIDKCQKLLASRAKRKSKKQAI